MFKNVGPSHIVTEQRIYVVRHHAIVQEGGSERPRPAPCGRSLGPNCDTAPGPIRIGATQGEDDEAQIVEILAAEYVGQPAHDRDHGCKNEHVTQQHLQDRYEVCLQVIQNSRERDDHG